MLVNQLGGFLQTFLVLFLTHRGFSDIHAATALGCYGAGCFAGVLIGGAFSDRLGPRFATFASMTGYAALLIAVLYLRNLPLLLTTVFAGRHWSAGSTCRPPRRCCPSGPRRTSR